MCVGNGLGSFKCDHVSLIPDVFKSTGVALGFLNPNRPPELMPIDDESMEELTSLTVSLSATDPDGDELSYSATDLPSFATPTDNGDGTGSILFEPKIGDAGSYEITVIVTDDGTPPESDSQPFTLTVTENLVIPPIIDPPIIDPAIIVPAIITPLLLD